MIFGAGVAAGKVGDAQVGAEQIGAIAQQFRLIESGRDAWDPSDPQEIEYRGRQCSCS